ncbi:MAG: hypothetical protein LBM27_02490 [Lactobacillaceae bacterium]|nr:hypothetical protein [Lactobacillaceae bacterium]
MTIIGILLTIIDLALGIFLIFSKTMKQISNSILIQGIVFTVLGFISAYLTFVHLKWFLLLSAIISMVLGWLLIYQNYLYSLQNSGR